MNKTILSNVLLYSLQLLVLTFFYPPTNQIICCILVSIKKLCPRNHADIVDDDDSDNDDDYDFEDDFESDDEQDLYVRLLFSIETTTSAINH